MITSGILIILCGVKHRPGVQSRKYKACRNKTFLRHTMGRQWKQCQTLFLGALKSLQMVTAAMKLKDAYPLEGKL